MVTKRLHKASLIFGCLVVHNDACLNFELVQRCLLLKNESSDAFGMLVDVEPESTAPRLIEEPKREKKDKKKR
jgi:hypothetical protein